MMIYRYACCVQDRHIFSVKTKNSCECSSNVNDSMCCKAEDDDWMLDSEVRRFEDRGSVVVLSVVSLFPPK